MVESYQGSHCPVVVVVVVVSMWRWWCLVPHTL